MYLLFLLTPLYFWKVKLSPNCVGEAKDATLFWIFYEKRSIHENKTIFNIIRLVAGSMGQVTHQPSIWCSKHFFFIISYRHRALKTLYFHFCKFTKINWDDFAKNFARNCENKIILGTSELGWRVICPSEPANQRIIL